MVDELYRFVQLRGVSPALADDNLLIRAWSDPPSELENQLVAASEAGEDPAPAAQQWLNEAGQQGPFAALRRLDAAIIGPVDNMTVASLRGAVHRYLDTREVLDRARMMAQDALIAAVLIPDMSPEDRDTAHRLVVLAVAGQKTLQWGPDREDDRGDGDRAENGDDEAERRDRTLRDILTRGAAVLPGRISRLLSLPAGQREERRALPRAGGVLGPAGAGDGDERRPRVAADQPGELRLRRDTALAELVAIVIDPDVEPEVIPALAEAPPDEAAARLRPTGEMTLRPPRVLLRGVVRERLSDATRTLLDEVSPGQIDLLSAVDAVERASLWAAPVARAERAAANDPTGGFPRGYGALRPPVQGLVRPPGVGDLLIVRRQHAQYVLGPITYIENVLAGETRGRTHRRLDRTEEQTFFETERTVVDERDLQTTERFDLVSETTNEVNAQTQLQVGAQVSGSYGTVQASASFGFTSSAATTEATRVATTTSRETVDRALKRISERTLERRQRITIREVEETNRHELTNTPGGPNRAGIYRFVDDEQTVGVYDYGMRLMFEAHVPEPGAYLRWATTAPASTTDPEPPKPSLPDGTTLANPSQLEPANYLMVAGRYDAVVEPPPLLLQTVAMSGRQEYNQNTPDAATAAFLFYRSEDRLQIPDGYHAVSAAGVMYASAWKFDVYVAVGTASVRGPSSGAAMPLVFSMSLGGETGTIPFAFTINNAWGFAYTLEVTCQRSDRALERWQIQTFNVIMQAYNDQHSAWQERQRAASISSAGVVTGTNPALNRQAERAELKKAVISLLSGSALDRFGAIEQATPDAEPRIDDLATVGQSAVIAFYEQALEWDNTTYTLYPYFWARHTSWRNAFTGDGVDPLHDAFLEAGLARVVVPVRPGFEQVALWFLATGQIWYGGAPPPISGADPLYVSVAAELLAADEADKGGVLLGDTWPVRTPTNLVYLQRDANLNPPP
jgi:hypothetical protein